MRFKPVGALANYGGLIEVTLSFFGVSAFVWWQMRELKRDVAAREAREREAAATNQNKPNPSS
jgi:hypothetical protein